MEELKKVTLSDPEIIGAYSLDADRNYQNNMDGLKYLKLPNFSSDPIDLKEGDYKDKNKDYDVLERIKHMTSYIMDNPESVVKDRRIDADFVCFRGALKYLMTTPFTKTPSWVVKAVKYKGTIYFIIEIENKQTNDNKKPDDKSYQYGFKFESYVLSSDPDKDPKGKSEVVNENEEFCILMSRTIDNTIKIVFGMESDGVEGPKVNSLDDLKKSKLVEVKSRIEGKKGSRFEKNYNEFDYIHENLKRDWWCQSYIASISQIHVGFRDSRGIVNKKTEVFQVESLVDQTTVQTCLEFLNDFLNQVKQYMNNFDDAKQVYCIKWNPDQNKIDVELDESEMIFLSQNYINFINGL